MSSLATKLAQFGCAVDPTTGALTPPIHLSTTFERDEDLGFSRGHVYSRWSNPTRTALEDGIADLEGGTAGFAFASGLAAFSALLQALGPSGLVLFPTDTYHGVRAALTGTFREWGLRSVEVDMCDADAVARALAAARADGYGVPWSGRGPLLLHLETPSNPSLRVTDVEACAAAGRAAGAVVCVDATWMTPVLCRPIALGADVVLHSTTKYLGGHADVLGGVLVLSDARPEAAALIGPVRNAQRITGGVAAPFDCWLVMRGLRSLLPRMRMHCASAARCAAYLAAHPSVVAVMYPGLPEHPGHAVAARQFGAAGFGGMLSVRVRGGRAAAVAFTNRLRIFKRATSLGGTESLVEHRRSVEGEASTSPDDLIRVSIGLEDAEELVADLAQALELEAVAASESETN